MPFEFKIKEGALEVTEKDDAGDVVAVVTIHGAQAVKHLPVYRDFMDAETLAAVEAMAR